MKRKLESPANRTPAIRTALSAVASFLCASHAHAAGSLLRVACEGADVGAEVTINGQFKGECPLDIQVGAGTIQLRLLKKTDAERERVFEQTFRIGDGVVKKVDAVLSALQLNAEGHKREQEREAVRQAAIVEERKRAEEMLQQLKDAAEAGNAPAMLELAERYAAGAGAEKSDQQADAWFRKLAEIRPVLAEFRMSRLYTTANKQDAADVMRMLALPAGDAIARYLQQANRGDARAMNAVAGLFYSLQNLAESARWHRAAADAGVVHSMVMLATLYFIGYGVPKSESESIAWRRKAAEHGDVVSADYLKALNK